MLAKDVWRGEGQEDAKEMLGRKRKVPEHEQKVCL